MKTDIFIIESLTRPNEKDQLYEGKFIKDYLDVLTRIDEIENRKKISKKYRPIYCYIRTPLELEEIAIEFSKGGYTKLFLSCHGIEKGIRTTYGDIKYDKFAEVFGGRLDGKRIFFSSCETGKRDFADAIFATNPSMKSFTAPVRNVEFKATYAFWTSFFYKLSDMGDNPQNRTIKNILSNCAQFYGMKMLYCEKDETWEYPEWA